jgi:hypothetical protein
MKRWYTISVAAAAAFLSGCVIIDVDDARARDEPPTARPATCDIAAYQSLIGQGDRQIDRSRLPQTYRVICFECQATMDYNANRLTIQLDRENRVAAVSCG